MGRLADGWFPQVAPGEALDASRAHVEAGAHGLDPDIVTIGKSIGSGVPVSTTHTISGAIMGVGAYLANANTAIDRPTMPAGIGLKLQRRCLE